MCSGARLHGPRPYCNGGDSGGNHQVKLVMIRVVTITLIIILATELSFPDPPLKRLGKRRASPPL